MDSLFYILPLLFGVVGWATEHYEMYMMSGILSFFTAYTLINEASPLTDNVLMIALIYVGLAMSFMLRLTYEAYNTKK
jgi:hypothetical protein